MRDGVYVGTLQQPIIQCKVFCVLSYSIGIVSIGLGVLLPNYGAGMGTVAWKSESWQCRYLSGSGQHPLIENTRGDQFEVQTTPTILNFV